MPVSPKDTSKSTDLGEILNVSAPPSYVGAPPPYNSEDPDEKHEALNRNHAQFSLALQGPVDVPVVLESADHVNSENRPRLSASTIPSLAFELESPSDEHSPRRSLRLKPVSSSSRLRSRSLSAVPASALVGPHGTLASRSGVVPIYESRIPPAILSSLQRLKKIRGKALRYRAAAREENSHIRNLQKNVIQELYNFIEAIKEARTQTSAGQTDESVNWDECLINVEDYIEESETAGKRSDRKHAQLDTMEQELREGEDEIYEQLPSSKPNPNHSRGDGSDRSNDDPDSPLTKAMSPRTSSEPQVIDDFMALLNQANQEAPDDDISDEDKDEDYVMLSDTGEDLALLGSKFSNVEEGKFSKLDEQRASIDLESQLPSINDERFMQWRLHGRPFADRTAARGMGDAATLSTTFDVMCKWIWENLLVVLGSGVSSSALAIRDTTIADVGLQEFRRLLIEKWLWTPDAGLKNDQEEVRELQEQAGLDIPVRIQAIRDDATHAGHRQQQNHTDQANLLAEHVAGDVSNTTNSAHSRRKHPKTNSIAESSPKVALSEQLQDYVGRSDFVVQASKERKKSLP